MTPEERQQRIEQYLQRVEYASLEELAREMDASVSTVRRDVTLLEANGGVRRTHGGARLVNPPSDEFVFNARDTHQLAEKEAIGRACAELIQPPTERDRGRGHHLLSRGSAPRGEEAADHHQLSAGRQPLRLGESGRGGPHRWRAVSPVGRAGRAAGDRVVFVDARRRGDHERGGSRSRA
ncbi:MAG: DeoR family transcriptional regulator [Verrucomicrobia bacterium]|nr:DeoR family transcriptional regulator [Verrucomicrobiota bacterium]